MSDSQNIILIGFKSCGKSTVGRLLADRLRYAFTDLDDTIHQILSERYRIQWNCWEFYATYGADKFREIETEALQRHIADMNTVLATGGGAPLPEENRDLLSQLGTVCYIRTDPDVIFERFRQNKTMPAYMDEHPTMGRLRAIWQTRHAVYTELADIEIGAGTQSPDRITNDLIKRLN